MVLLCFICVCSETYFGDPRNMSSTNIDEYSPGGHELTGRPMFHVINL